MLTLLLLAIGAPLDPDLAFGRFASYMKAHPTYAVDFTSVTGDKGTIHVRKPMQFRFDLKNAKTDYAFIRSGSKGLEYDRATRFFADAYIGPNFQDYEAQLSGAPSELMPRALLTGDLHIILPGKAQATAGSNGDVELVSRPPDPEQKSVIKATVDSQGRLTHYEVHIHTQYQSEDVTVSFSNYRDDPKATFGLKPPMGFYVLNTVKNDPLEAGQPLHLGSWIDDHGQTVALDGQIGNGKAVLVILDASELPSKRAIAHLGELASSLKGKGKFLALTTTKASAIQIGHSDIPAYYGAAGSQVEALMAPGVPLYYLIEQGKVVRIWMGDDEHTRAQTFADIVDAVAASRKLR
jgi:hypothetical protein